MFGSIGKGGSSHSSDGSLPTCSPFAPISSLSQTHEISSSPPTSFDHVLFGKFSQGINLEAILLLLNSCPERERNNYNKKKKIVAQDFNFVKFVFDHDFL